jgi:hypothetical protein
MSGITIKQKVESGGLNTIYTSLETVKGGIRLYKTHTQNNPYKYEEKSWNISNKRNWSNDDFIYSLKNLLKEL